jgi:hypothetical protein
LDDRMAIFVSFPIFIHAHQSVWSVNTAQAFWAATDLWIGEIDLLTAYRPASD